MIEKHPPQIMGFGYKFTASSEDSKWTDTVEHHLYRGGLDGILMDIIRTTDPNIHSILHWEAKTAFNYLAAAGQRVQEQERKDANKLDGDIHLMEWGEAPRKNDLKQVQNPTPHPDIIPGLSIEEAQTEHDSLIEQVMSLNNSRGLYAILNDVDRMRRHIAALKATDATT